MTTPSFPLLQLPKLLMDTIPSCCFFFGVCFWIVLTIYQHSWIFWPLISVVCYNITHTQFTLAKKLVPTPSFHTTPPKTRPFLSYPPPKLSPAVDCYVIVVAAVRFIVLLAIVVVDDVLSPSRLGHSGIHHDNMAANFWQITASPLTLKPCSTMPLVLHFNHGDQFWPI